MSRRLGTVLLWSAWSLGALGGFIAVISLWIFVISGILYLAQPATLVEDIFVFSALATVSGAFAFLFLCMPSMGILQSDRRLRR